MRCDRWFWLKGGIGAACGIGLAFLPGWFKLLPVAAMVLVTLEDKLIP